MGKRRGRDKPSMPYRRSKTQAVVMSQFLAEQTDDGLDWTTTEVGHYKSDRQKELEAELEARADSMSREQLSELYTLRISSLQLEVDRREKHLVALRKQVRPDEPSGEEEEPPQPRRRGRGFLGRVLKAISPRPRRSTSAPTPRAEGGPRAAPSGAGANAAGVASAADAPEAAAAERPRAESETAPPRRLMPLAATPAPPPPSVVLDERLRSPPPPETTAASPSSDEAPRTTVLPGSLAGVLGMSTPELHTFFVNVDAGKVSPTADRLLTTFLAVFSHDCRAVFPEQPAARSQPAARHDQPRGAVGHAGQAGGAESGGAGARPGNAPLGRGGARTLA